MGIVKERSRSECSEKKMDTFRTAYVGTEYVISVVSRELFSRCFCDSAYITGIEFSLFANEIFFVWDLITLSKIMNYIFILFPKYVQYISQISLSEKSYFINEIFICMHTFCFTIWMIMVNLSMIWRKNSIGPPLT